MPSAAGSRALASGNKAKKHARVAPADAAPLSTSRNQQPAAAPPSRVRLRSRRGLPSETDPAAVAAAAPPNLERRRTKGTLVLDQPDSAPIDNRPHVRVAFADQRPGSSPTEEPADGDGIRLLRISKLDGTASTWVGGFGSRSPFPQSMKRVAPSELVGKSLIAGKQALLAHFGLLAYHQCSIVDLDVLDTLLSRGADVNAHDSLGQTAMHEVARLWDTRVACHLISKGAAVDHADRYGRQPIHVAASEDSVELLQLFLDHGIDMNVKTGAFGQSPVHHAASNDSVKALALLVENGAEYEDCDYVGRTPMQLAVELDRTESVRYLLSLSRPAFSGVQSSDGRKALTAMIVKMPEVAVTAFSQFHSTSASQRSQLFWLNYLEHAPVSESEVADGGGVRETCRALTPLEVIVEGKHYSLLTTPIVLRSLKAKWNFFGRRSALVQTIIYFLSVLVWTVVAVAGDWETRYKYPGNQVWRIAFEVIAVCFLMYDVFNEILEYFRSRRQHERWAAWRLTSLQRDLADCHPACPDEAQYIRQEIENVNKSSSSYFEDLWNVLDWLCYLLMIASVTSHVIDIGQHTRTIARVHAAIIVTTIIVMWARLLKYLRGFRNLGPFVVMVTRIVRDTFKILFLYVLFFVPYACGFWVFFGKRSVITDTSMNTTVSGFANEAELVFQLFMASIGNEAFISNIEKIDAPIARLLVGTFLALTGILLLNLLIALMSDTFQRVHDNVVQNALMQQAATVVSVERNMTKADRQKFREHIAKRCAPERVYYDDDDADQEDLQKIARRTYDEVVELKDYLSDRFEDQDGELREEVAALRQEITELRLKLDSAVLPQLQQAQGRRDQHAAYPLSSTAPAVTPGGRVKLPSLQQKQAR